jgi:hypothetical protein
MMLELNYIAVPNNIEIGGGGLGKIGGNRAQVLVIYSIIFSLPALMLIDKHFNSVYE